LWQKESKRTESRKNSDTADYVCPGLRGKDGDVGKTAKGSSVSFGETKMY
jgi:hypothetical protein